ncbi:RNA 2',3'-cyclic phosphodiesterase [Legionella jamestowniensis]|nr:RNA 2',3'-cyclic phosphodiesterase [Legionella jamestowniensis]
MKARVFFAISFSEKLKLIFKEILGMLQSTIPEKKVRWTPISNLHITLAFLGNIQVEHLPQLIERANQALSDMPFFLLQFGKLELFPSTADPRIISLSISHETVLKNLAHRLRQIIAAMHYPIEERAFRGHLTLGRLQHCCYDHGWLNKIQLPVIPEMKVTQVVLFESKPDQGSPNYIPLAQFNLK